MSPRFVLDASVAIAWAMGEDTSPEFLKMIDDGYVAGFIVPTHWRLEVANGIIGKLSRARKDFAEVEKLLAEVDALPFVVDARTDAFAWTRTRVLAIRNRESTLDMAYVELALREGGVLLTLDKGMKRAATNEGAYGLL